MLFCTRCAQITPLTGGKKDTDAPRLLNAIPKNASINFSAKEIVLEFNEFIVLKDVANQLIVTPQLKEQPNVEVSGKKVKISFGDSLLPNTTYKLAFGNAITDLRENNPFQSFEYILSTGQTIDSLKLSGNVTNAFDNRPGKNVLVSLYDSNSNDSMVYHHKPLYISRTDEAGNFKFSYLPDHTFKLVAVKDNNKNLMYDGPDEMIGFVEGAVKPDSTRQTIRLFREQPARSYCKKSYAPEYGKALIVFNKPYIDYGPSECKGVFAYSKSPAADTLTLYYKDLFDTARVFIQYKDRKADTVTIRLMTRENYLKQMQKGAIRYTIATNISNGVLGFFDMPVLSLNYPVATDMVDKNLVRLTEIKDSARTNLPFTLKAGAGNMTLGLDTKLKEGLAYELSLKKGALADGTGRTSDSALFKFKTSLPEDYAQLSVKLLFPKKETYIVQLLNDKEQVVRTETRSLSLTSTAEQKFDFRNLAPGSYLVKVIEDTNKNGRFDEGNFLRHLQPEIIYYNTNPIKLLADWEIENEWKVQ